MNSGMVVETMVVALADLTCLSVHALSLFVTISKERIRSSARPIFLSKNPASAVAPCEVLPLK